MIEFDTGLGDTIIHLHTEGDLSAHVYANNQNRIRLDRHIGDIGWLAGWVAVCFGLLVSLYCDYNTAAHADLQHELQD